MTEKVNAALVRKLSTGQDNAARGNRSVLRALRLACAREAEDKFNLSLTVIGAKQATRMPSELCKSVQDDWLLLLVDSDNTGPAAFCLDPGCVSAILQKQTIGEVLANPPQSRVFTDTDAAMTSPLAEGVLRRAKELVDAPTDVSSLSGLEFSARAKDLRSLTLALIDASYRVFDLTGELAGGARQGHVCVVLPETTVTEDAEAVESVDNGPNLDQAAGVIRAELQSVICRMSLPLAELSNLQIGDVVPLNGVRLDHTEITTIDRTRIAVGRLGQSGGMRAIRINEQVREPALLASDQSLHMQTGLAPEPQDWQAVEPTREVIKPVTMDSTELIVPDRQQVTYATPEHNLSDIRQFAGSNETDEQEPVG
ncbi:FliM/FliN family flagellar motor switch protein [Ruegeria arenilitoris]|uniref:FliM/FliN family flagellar motor switch protein n=1 Tax=Ruegeria arenilitoris TaxID=1173585 RepID=UPI00147F06E3|nr:flagellar motor switch protein FliM [Ruegeria arenilitoris]